VNVKVGRQNPLLLITFMEQIVNSRDLIMLVVVEAFLGIVCFKTKLLKHVNYFRLYWYNILANNKSLVSADWLIEVEPFVFSYISTRVSSVWVSVQYLLNQLLSNFRNKRRNFVISSENFFVKLGCIWVFKGQIPTNHGV